MVYTSIEQLFKTYGLNFYGPFIDNDKLKASREFILKHSINNYFLSDYDSSMNGLAFSPYFMSSNDVDKIMRTIYRDIHETQTVTVYYQEHKEVMGLDKFFMRIRKTTGIMTKLINVLGELQFIQLDKYKEISKIKKHTFTKKRKKSINFFEVNSFFEQYQKYSFLPYWNFIIEIFLFELCNDKRLFKRFFPHIRREFYSDLDNFLNPYISELAIQELTRKKNTSNIAYKALMLHDKLNLSSELINILFDRITNNIEHTKDEKLYELSKLYRGEGIEKFQAGYLLNNMLNYN